MNRHILYSNAFCRSEYEEGTGGGGQEETTNPGNEESPADTLLSGDPGNTETSEGGSPEEGRDDAGSEESADDGFDLTKYGSEGFDMQKFRSALGLPEKAEDYSLEIDESVSLPEETLAFLKQEGYENGVPPQAMKRIAEGYNQHVLDNLMQMKLATKEALEQEYGQNLGSELDQVKGFLQREAEKAGVERDFLKNEHIGNSKDLIKLLIHFKDLAKEPESNGLSSEIVSARAEAKRMAEDPTHPLYEAYHDTNHKDNGYAHKKYNDAFLS